MVQEFISHNGFIYIKSDNVDSFVTYNGFLYKKIADVGSIFKVCPHCQAQFFTKEQRKIYCTNACKMKAYRERNDSQETDDSLK